MPTKLWCIAVGTLVVSCGNSQLNSGADVVEALRDEGFKVVSDIRTPPEAAQSGGVLELGSLEVNGESAALIMFDSDTYDVEPATENNDPGTAVWGDNWLIENASASTKAEFDVLEEIADALGGTLKE